MGCGGLAASYVRLSRKELLLDGKHEAKTFYFLLANQTSNSKLTQFYFLLINSISFYISDSSCVNNGRPQNLQLNHFPFPSTIERQRQTQNPSQWMLTEEVIAHGGAGEPKEFMLSQKLKSKTGQQPWQTQTEFELNPIVYILWYEMIWIVCWAGWLAGWLSRMWCLIIIINFFSYWLFMYTKISLPKNISQIIWIFMMIKNNNNNKNEMIKSKISK